MNIRPVVNPKNIRDIKPHNDPVRMHLENLLLKYLKKYLKKQFLMSNVFKNLKVRLNRQQLITEKQLETLMPFIEREREFKGFDRMKIKEYFKPILCRKTDRVVVGTLDEFF